jgi:hypothetical protein
MATAAGEPLDEPTDAGQRWLDDAVPLEERAALATQGFVAFHTLPSGQRCAKLRFRDSSGRQRVRYLGANAELAAQVAAALKARQRCVRRRRASRQVARSGRRALRGIKCRLEAPLRCAGWRFHGLSLRRRRRSNSDGPAAFGDHQPTHFRSLVTMDDELRELAETANLPRPADPQIFDELRRSAIEHVDPAQAVLRYTAAQLMDLSSSLYRPIKAELDGAPDLLDALEDLTPGLDMMLKLGRQADRFFNVALKHDGDPSSAKAKNRDLDTYASSGVLTADGSAASEPDGQGQAMASRPR